MIRASHWHLCTHALVVGCLGRKVPLYDHSAERIRSAYLLCKFALELRDANRAGVGGGYRRPAQDATQPEQVRLEAKAEEQPKRADRSWPFVDQEGALPKQAQGEASAVQLAGMHYSHV